MVLANPALGTDSYHELSELIGEGGSAPLLPDRLSELGIELITPMAATPQEATRALLSQTRSLPKQYSSNSNSESVGNQPQETPTKLLAESDLNPISTPNKATEPQSVPPTQDFSPCTSQKEGFSIIGELGSGSFSVIYEVDDYARGTRAAIKMEKPDKARAILVSEYELMCRVNGLPGVVPVIDFVSQEHMGNPNFIVMPLMGRNMAVYRRDLGAHFCDWVALDLISQMLRSIEAVHKAGIIHRDVKPVSIHFIRGRILRAILGQLRAGPRAGTRQLESIPCGLWPRQRAPGRGWTGVPLTAHL